MLTQNSKIKKSLGSTRAVYNFGIPAFLSKDNEKTCPMAGVCASGCYARSGTYNFDNVKSAYEKRYETTKSTDFVDLMNAEIKLLSLRNKGKELYIRIHDSGDFYKETYLAKWLTIINDNPSVKFYAYTKMVSMFKSLDSLPNNFRVIYSYGGKQDHLIDPINDPHSTVFESIDQLNEYGYTDCSEIDLEVFNTNHVGLIYHGVKAYRNTYWNKVIKFLNPNQAVA